MWGVAKKQEKKECDAVMSVKLCRSNTEARIGSGRDGGGVAEEDVEMSRAFMCVKVTCRCMIGTAT